MSLCLPSLMSLYRPLLSLTVAFHRATTQPRNQLIVHERAGTMRPLWSPQAVRPWTGAQCTGLFIPANALWQALSHRFSDKLLDSGRGFLNLVLVKRLRAMTQLTTGLSDDSPFQREYAPQVEGKEKGNHRAGHEARTEPVYWLSLGVVAWSLISSSTMKLNLIYFKTINILEFILQFKFH